MRAAVYKDEVTLWRDTALKSPGKARPLNGLGDALKKAGDLEEARRHLERALELQPDYADALNNLATIYCKIGRNDECYELLLKALSLNSSHVPARYNLALYYYQKGLLEDAIQEYNSIIMIEPLSEEAVFAGQMLLMIQGPLMRDEKRESKK
jgi:tetratricopeptide (TPR) repeat protein